MVVRTPSLVYIYIFSIVSRDHMNENQGFLLSLSLNKYILIKTPSKYVLKPIRVPNIKHLNIISIPAVRAAPCYDASSPHICIFDLVNIVFSHLFNLELKAATWNELEDKLFY